MILIRLLPVKRQTSRYWLKHVKGRVRPGAIEIASPEDELSEMRARTLERCEIVVAA